MSPTIVNVLLAVQITEQAEYCALIFGAAEVAPLDVIVTPDPAAKVTCPAPICCTLITSLAENTEGGTVTVIPEALDSVTSLLTSLDTKV
jgi:hypothetical protein